MKDTRKAIVRAAVELFAQRGYYNVSMREIAGAIGVRAGSLYNHFDSKEAILEEVLDMAGEFLSHLKYEANQITDMLRTRTPRQILRDFATYYEDEDNNERIMINRLLYMEMYNRPRVLEFVYEYFVARPAANLKSAMDALMEAGAIPSGDSLAIAELWNRTCLVYGYMAAHGLENSPREEYDAMTDFFIEMAVRGVRVIPVEAIDGDWRQARSIPDCGESPAGTREMILHRALDLFSRYGYASVGVRQIAEAVGIRAGSLYNHFPGKDMLMQEIVDTFLMGVRRISVSNPEMLSALESHNHSDIIRMLSFSYTPGEKAEAYKVYRVLFREQYANPALGKIFLDSIERDKRMIIRGNEEHVLRGMVRPSDIRKIATAYVHTMCSLSIGATTDIQFGNEEHLRPRTVAVLVSLIAHGYLDRR